MPNPVSAPSPLEPGTLRIIPAGGLGEIGRNMTVFEIDGKILIVDCGVLFPEENQPGVDLILPDFAPVRDRLDDFDATSAGRAIQELVDELSNWYVRRSRRRFWEGDLAAFTTLRRCLVTVAQLLAPFCPFIADEIFDNLDGSEPSVHLCDFPVAAARDPKLEHAMAVVRETVRLGLHRLQACSPAAAPSRR